MVVEETGRRRRKRGVFFKKKTGIEFQFYKMKRDRQ